MRSSINVNRYLTQPTAYLRKGLLFIKKDSSYVSGISDECFIWMDPVVDHNFNENISKILMVIIIFSITNAL